MKLEDLEKELKITTPSNLKREARLPLYPVLGLCGESGEIAEEYKKQLRKEEAPENSFKVRVVLEMGDVLYYLLRISKDLGVQFEDVVEIYKAKQSLRNTHGKNKSAEELMAWQKMKDWGYWDE